jgi:hypothetical protein
LTLFLKVLEKQQEASLSTGFGAQKLGSPNDGPDISGERAQAGGSGAQAGGQGKEAPTSA